MPLHPAAKEALEAYLPHRPPSASLALFLTVRGATRSPRTVEHTMAGWAARAGVQASPKLLRSTFG